MEKADPPTEENSHSSTRSLGTGCLGFLVGGGIGILIAIAIFFLGLGISFVLLLLMAFLPSADWPGTILDLMQNSRDFIIYAIILGSAFLGGYTGFASGKVPGRKKQKPSQEN